MGNHEFDNNIDGLLPFLMNANFTILSSNINVDSEPRIKPYVKKSFVTTVGGEKIGVIGYTTKDTPMISQPGEFVRLVEGGDGGGGGFGRFGFTFA